MPFQKKNPLHTLNPGEQAWHLSEAAAVAVVLLLITLI